MQEIMEQYQKVLDAIKNCSLSYQVKEVLKQILEDEFLQRKIKEYQKNPSVEQKKVIYQNASYQTYKKLENEVNFLILKCNVEWKKLKKGDSLCE